MQLSKEYKYTVNNFGANKHDIFNLFSECSEVWAPLDKASRQSCIFLTALEGEMLSQFFSYSD
jgi:hypothetical protein